MHELKEKRKNMEAIKNEINAIEQDMSAAVMTSHRDMPNLPADRLVTAHQNFNNRKHTTFDHAEEEEL